MSSIKSSTGGTRRAGRRSRGYFGVAIWHPKSEANVGTLWRTAFLYEAAFVATVGRRYKKQASDTPGVANHVPLMHFSDIDDMVEHLPYSCPLIGVELDNRSIPLNNYTHPMRGVYLLGAEDHGLPPEVLERCHQVVQIPGERDWSMNVSAAGSIVIYDRWAKTSRAAMLGATA